MSRDNDDAVDGGEPADRDLDPEYKDLLSQQNKQQRLLEHGGMLGRNNVIPRTTCKAIVGQGILYEIIITHILAAQEATIKKIVTIVREQFAEEMQYKESEIALIDQVFRKLRKKVPTINYKAVSTTHFSVSDWFPHICPLHGIYANIML